MGVTAHMELFEQSGAQISPGAGNPSFDHLLPPKRWRSRQEKLPKRMSCNTSFTGCEAAVGVCLVGVSSWWVGELVRGLVIWLPCSQP